MFRTRTVGILVVAILVVTAGAMILLGSLKSERKQEAESSLTTAQPAVEAEFRRIQATQALVAHEVASSNVKSALATLKELHDDMEEVEQEYLLIATSKNLEKTAELRTKFISSFPKGDEALSDFFARSYADKVQKGLGSGAFAKQNGREGFETSEKTRFVKCLAVAARQCYWDYAYINMMETLAGFSGQTRIPMPKRVIITDEDGVGLADSENSEWSDDQNFAKTNELSKKARETRESVRDIIKIGEFVHLATAYPIVDGDVLIGSVIVADPINRWLADTFKNVVGADVAFVANSGVIDTSMSPDVAKLLTKNTKDVEGWSASMVPISGFPIERGVSVLVASNVENILAPYRNAKVTIVLVAIVTFLVLVMVLLLNIRSFFKEIEALYQGVHEVINGRLDYQFSEKGDEDILGSLGHSLNLAFIVAQGKEIPWDSADMELFGAISSPNPAWGGVSAREDGVPDSVSEAENECPDPDFNDPAIAGLDVGALFDEPAEAYYKRVHVEFLEARKSAGIEDESMMALQDFMRRLISLEQKLKKKRNCKAVRFVVSQREGEVILVPVNLK